jgi:secreted Zn-dependent insulinase-like peptidase
MDNAVAACPLPVVEHFVVPAELTKQQVQGSFARMSGHLKQSLKNWANNNPVQHATYGASHLLQQHHHHNSQLLSAAAAATPQLILQLQQQLTSGRDLHLDMLAYGNISRPEVQQLVQQVQQQLRPQGLPDLGSWPAAGRVFCLTPAAATFVESMQQNLSSAAANEDCAEHDCTIPSTAVPTAPEAAKGDDATCGAPYICYLPTNPNPANSNHAMCYTAQLGPDSVQCSVLLDLFVQLSSKAAFHELRTRQRLGYSVSLSSTSLHRQLGLELRIQSPTADPNTIVTAAR